MLTKTQGILRIRNNDLQKAKNKIKSTKKRLVFHFYCIKVFKGSTQKIMYNQNIYQLQDVVQSSLLTPETRPSDVQMSDCNDEPEWLSEYHRCDRVLCEVDQLTQEIVKEQGRKMMAINEKKHDQIIEKKMQQATQKVQACQKILKTIQRKSKEQINTQHTNKVFSNMIISLAINIKDKAKKLRNVQQNQLSRNKELAQYTKNTQLDNAPMRVSNFDDLQGQAWLSEQTFQVLQQRMMNERNEQIMKIVKSVHALNTIYKQLQQLVIHQGSLLDRIDENIQSTHQNVKKANEHLTKAQEHQKSSCSKKVMMVLAALISICLVILIIKYT